VAELLVYKGKHWTETFSKEERRHWTSDIWKKWRSRYRRGDIMEAHKDEHFRQRRWHKPYYVLIRIPGVPIEEVQRFVNRPVKFPRRRLSKLIKLPHFKQRYWIDIDQLKIKDSQITLNEGWRKRIKRKTLLTPGAREGRKNG
jgi:hypothetical protein